MLAKNINNEIHCKSPFNLKKRERKEKSLIIEHT
jgi:hypothetical protein